MKKYIMPSVKVIQIENHELLCASLPIGSTPGDQMLSREMGGWNSENWVEVEEEEDFE